MPASPLKGADIPELTPDTATTPQQTTPQLITPGSAAGCATCPPKGDSTAHMGADPEPEEEEFDDWGLTELAWRDYKWEPDYATLFRPITEALAQPQPELSLADGPPNHDSQSSLQHRASSEAIVPAEGPRSNEHPCSEDLSSGELGDDHQAGLLSTSSGVPVCSSTLVSAMTGPLVAAVLVPQIHIEYSDDSSPSLGAVAPHSSTNVGGSTVIAAAGTADSGRDLSLARYESSTGVSNTCTVPFATAGTPSRHTPSSDACGSLATGSRNLTDAAVAGRSYSSLVASSVPPVATSRPSSSSPPSASNGVPPSATTISSHSNIALPMTGSSPGPPVAPSGGGMRSSGLSSSPRLPAPVPGPSSCSPSVRATPRPTTSVFDSSLMDGNVPSISRRSISTQPTPAVSASTVVHHPSVALPISEHTSQHGQAQLNGAVLTQSTLVNGHQPDPRGPVKMSVRESKRAEIFAKASPEWRVGIQRLWESGEKGWQILEGKGLLRLAKFLFEDDCSTAGNRVSSAHIIPPVPPQMSPPHVSQPRHDVRSVAAGAGHPATSSRHVPLDAAHSTRPIAAPRPVHAPVQSSDKSDQPTSWFVLQSPVLTPQQILDRYHGSQGSTPVRQSVTNSSMPTNTVPSTSRTPVTQPAVSPYNVVPSPNMVARNQPRIMQPAGALARGMLAGPSATRTPGNVQHAQPSFYSRSMSPQIPTPGPSRLTPSSHPSQVLPGRRGRTAQCCGQTLNSRDEAIDHLRSEEHDIDNWGKRDGKTRCQMNERCKQEIKDIMGHVLSVHHYGGMDLCARCGEEIGWRDGRHKCVIVENGGGQMGEGKRRRDEEDELDDDLRRKRKR